MSHNSTEAGQAVYSKSVLSIYDLWVLGISNRYFWKCPTALIGEQFNQLTSSNHLDVGVGSGYYLKHYLPNDTRRLALMDLNENSLSKASSVVAHLAPETYSCDVLSPLELDVEKFDSISINYLLHCLPGNLSTKSEAFKHLAGLLNTGGTLFGSTILGRGTNPNAPARKLMALYNKKGIFSNSEDDLPSLEAELSKYFTDVNIKLIGCVALFSGKKQ